MGPQFIEEITCGGCMRTGHATWDRSVAYGRALVEISPAFDYRSHEGIPDLMVIVCGHCGTVQPDQLSTRPPSGAGQLN
jgi:hypothetical protein